MGLWSVLVGVALTALAGGCSDAVDSNTMAAKPGDAGADTEAGGGAVPDDAGCGTAPDKPRPPRSDGGVSPPPPPEDAGGAADGGAVDGRDGSAPAPVTISADFTGLGVVMAPDEVAGVQAAPRWTSVAAGFTGFRGSLAGLVDANGDATTARITWTTTAMQASGFITDAPGDARMMRGAIGGIGVATLVVLEKLPAAWAATGYDVYVYVRSADASTTIPVYTGISDGVITQKAVLVLPAATFSPFVLATESVAGNYVVFENLTNSTFILLATGVVAGIQLVPHTGP